MKKKLKSFSLKMLFSLFFIAIGASLVLVIQEINEINEYKDKYVMVVKTHQGLLVQEFVREQDVFEFSSDEITEYRKMEVAVLGVFSSSFVVRLNVMIYQHGPNQYVKLSDVRKYVVVY